jgi:hypothetical protein
MPLPTVISERQYVLSNDSVVGVTSELALRLSLNYGRDINIVNDNDVLPNKG